MTKRILIGSIILIIMIVLGILMQIKYKESSKKEFELFYSSSINSKLKSISAGTGGTRIILENNKKYVFLPLINDKGYIFNNLAKKGDVIIKREFSDSLILLNNNEKLFFLFIKLQ